MTETPKTLAELLELANRAYADEQHTDLCDCSHWPDACVSGYVPAEWALSNAPDKILRTIAEHAWIVPKIPHDQLAPVGPYIHGEWIHRDAGDSQAWHTREYAAQLLAAADEVDPAHQSAPEQPTDTTDRGDE